MSRRKLRVILATISLVLFALSIVTFFMYAYVNAELYMDYHKRGIVIVDIYMAGYAGLMGIMFIYSIVKSLSIKIDGINIIIIFSTIFS